MRRSLCLYQQKSWLARFESTWNERTGVSEITQLKESVAECSHKLDAANQELERAKQVLESSWNESTSLQRQHSELLRNRDVWTPDDANRFAALLQREVTLRDDLARAKTQAKTAEGTVASLRLDYMDRLRRRYQEEQVWQDKWRILGTYGTWSLIILNSLVFGLSQILYQRRELARMRQIENLLDERLPKQQVTQPSTGGEHQEAKRTERSEQNGCLDDAKPEEYKAEKSTEDEDPVRNETVPGGSQTHWSARWWVQGVRNASIAYKSHVRDPFHPLSAAIGATAASLFFALVFRN